MDTLSKVYKRLSASRCDSPDDWHQHRQEISDALDMASGLAKESPSLREFETFLQQGHDFHVCADSIVKSAMFRIIRLCISSQASAEGFVEAIKTGEWHWLVVASLEREPLQEHDSEYGRGRWRSDSSGLCARAYAGVKVGALYHAMRTYFIAFARSLVAISENNKDNIRRVCWNTA